MEKERPQSTAPRVYTLRVLERRENRDLVKG